MSGCIKTIIRTEEQEYSVIVDTNIDLIDYIKINVNDVDFDIYKYIKAVKSKSDKEDKYRYSKDFRRSVINIIRGNNEWDNGIQKIIDNIDNNNDTPAVLVGILTYLYKETSDINMVDSMLNSDVSKLAIKLIAINDKELNEILKTTLKLRVPLFDDSSDQNETDTGISTPYDQRPELRISED